MEPWLFGAIVGSICGAAAVLGLTLSRSAVRCPQCHHPLSVARLPSSSRQALWGGWICPGCGVEVDAKLQCNGGKTP